MLPARTLGERFVRVGSSTVYTESIYSATTMTTNLAILFMISWRYLKLPVPKPTEIMTYEAIRAVLRVVLRDSALSIVSLLGSSLIRALESVEGLTIGLHIVLTLVMMLANMGAIELSLNGNMLYQYVSLPPLHSRIHALIRTQLAFLCPVDIGQSFISPPRYEEHTKRSSIKLSLAG